MDAVGPVDSTPVMATPVMLAVIAGVVVVLLVATAVRVVPAHERFVVSRFGRVTRIVGPGVSLRWPGIETWCALPTQPVRLHEQVSATSRDGVPVHLQVAARCSVVEPVLCDRAHPDPLVATRGEIGSLVARAVGRTDVAGLLPSRLRLERELPERMSSRTTRWGVRVDEVEISDIEVRLTMSLLESLRHGRLEGSA